MQATSCSNGELYPSSASSKSAAFGNGRSASRIRVITTSMSNGTFTTGGTSSCMIPEDLRGRLYPIWPLTEPA